MKTRRQKAFTLIEMIGVIAAIGAIATAAVVPMIRRLDEAVRKKEANTLATFAEAYKQRALIERKLANETGWAAAVAAVTGLQPSAITSNDRGNARIFLIDPAMALGGSSLGSTQKITGLNARPVSPRLMLVSSASKALPTNLVSGVAAASGAYSFTNLWNTTDGAIPSSWTWTGRGDDLKIQRIDLSDLFVKVLLNNRDSTLTPKYAVTTGSTNNSNVDLLATNTVAYGCLAPMYLLKGTEIRLFNAASPNIMEYSEVLAHSTSFTFEYGTWQPESFLASSVGQTSPLDLQKAMNLFMAAPTNAFAKAGSSQTVVSNAMVAFLTNYIAWRDGTPAYNLTGSKPPKALEDAQTALATITGNLISTQ